MTPEELKAKILEVTPDFKSNGVILLTGAGFSKNFGGILGRDMYYEIFNNSLIQESKSLRSLLQSDYDFESAYSEVVGTKGRYSPEDQDIMRRVVEEAYKSMDETLRDWVFTGNNPYPVNPYKLFGDLFTKILAGNANTGTKGLFFTLNQDLFMERHYGYRWPGIPNFSQDFYGGIGGKQVLRSFVTVPNDEAIMKKAKEDFVGSNQLYIKLHGSYGWKSSDGSNNMVIGRDKMGLIAGNLILFWYFEIFARALFEGNKKLLIIGYGFGDEHINKLLVEAIQKHGLKIYIITTQSIDDLRVYLEEKHGYALSLMDGISGYFRHSLLEIFPADQSETEQLRKIKQALFPKA
jgi:hypothetical protein